MIRMKEVTGKGRLCCVSVPDAGIRLLSVAAHRLMEMFAADFHRERGVMGERSGGTPAGPGPMHKAGTGAGDGRHDLSADLSSDNTGDCHRKEVLLQVGTSKQALASAELSPMLY